MQIFTHVCDSRTEASHMVKVRVFIHFPNFSRLEHEVNNRNAGQKSENGMASGLDLMSSSRQIQVIRV